MTIPMALPKLTVGLDLGDPISGSVHGGTSHALRGEGPAVPPVVDRETFCTRLGPTRKLRHA